MPETCEVHIGRDESTMHARQASRVLYAVNLNPSMKFGSLEEQILLLAAGLANQGGILVPVFTVEPDIPHLQRYHGSGLVSAAIDLRRFRWSAFRALLRLIDQHGIRILHWNLYPPVNLYVLLLRLVRPQLKHLLTDHNSRPASNSRSNGRLKYVIRKWFAGLYAGVYGISNYVQSELVGQAIWKDPKRYYYFVNTDRFRPDVEVRKSVRAHLGVDDRFVVLLAAHLIPEKGIDIALRALTHLPPHVLLWVIGDGPDMNRLRQMAETLEVQNRTTFFGLRSDVSDLMRAGDCLLCPSLWQEAAGLVILEALACGLPVVGSRIGGIPEFVRSGESGFLFPAGNHAAAASYIQTLVESKSYHREMARTARTQAETQFSHKTRVSDALALYEAIVP